AAFSPGKRNWTAGLNVRSSNEVGKAQKTGERCGLNPFALAISFADNRAFPKTKKEITMGYEEILLSKNEAVATISLNRPDKLNAITPTMLAELNAAVRDAGEDENVRTIVLTGEGKAFSAGVDLVSIGDRKIKEGGVGSILDDPARRLIVQIETIPKIIIAKINGFCFTGALEIALACDLIAVAEEAKFGDTHSKWGLRPSWGMSQRLPRAVGMAKARELSYMAITFTGREAADWGMTTRCVPRAELDEAVNALTQTLGENSGGSLAAYKDLYREAQGRTLYEGLNYEASTAYVIDDTEERVSQFRK
ncbi:MAG: enoyl-CoA hydratase/isomerase family protein, partial [Candidatus Hydrogenedentes bacterium]|nr:enoyl-CoA hydratase/isomerase family protein [Candidatus Hydrogenedentota bacterium]